MTREEAVKRLKLFFSGIGTALSNKTKEAFNTLIPELAESEDERIRKFLVDILSSGTWRKEWPFSPADCVAYLEKQKEQKPVSYSPLCNTIKDKIREYVANHFVTDTVVNTDVKSIVKAMEEGVRLGKEEQKPAEWSEEDEIRLKEALEVLNESIKHLPFGYGYTEDVRLVTDWLKSLPERFNLQPKREWSEKDENMIRFYEMDYNNQIGNWSAKKVVEMRLAFKDWLCTRLKSIRPSWKPSPEQMYSLGTVVKGIGESASGVSKNLRDLYEQLKKL